MVSPQGNPFGKMPCRQGRLSVCRAFLHDSLLAITRAISELLPPPVPKIPEVKVEIVDISLAFAASVATNIGPISRRLRAGSKLWIRLRHHPRRHHALALLNPQRTS